MRLPDGLKIETFLIKDLFLSIKVFNHIFPLSQIVGLVLIQLVKGTSFNALSFTKKGMCFQNYPPQF